MPAPEGVVAVAQVGVAAAEEQPCHQDEVEVAQAPEEGDVLAAAALGEARALGEIRARQQDAHERRDLRRERRAVRVEHDDDVAGRRREARPQRVPLAAPGLGDDADLGHETPRHVRRPVCRAAVDEDHLGHPRRDQG